MSRACGFYFANHKGKVIRKLRQTSKRRIFARMKQLQRDYGEKRIDLKAIDQSIASIRGHIKHGNTNKMLREILRGFVLQRESEDAEWQSETETASNK